ncbi:MAG: hypothetical protein IJG87_05785 [Ruminococcus sp.]|nr:hypothetical protein [Ruminococcus sp.]
MEPIVFIILFVACVPLVLLIIFVPVIKDKKARNGVTNYDTFSKNYSFVLDCSKEKAIELLLQKSVADTLNYSFDQNSMIIQFEHLNAIIEYQLMFYTFENRTFLKVTRIQMIHDKSNIPFMINRFFIEKCGAEPVDYQCFRSLESSVNE